MQRGLNTAYDVCVSCSTCACCSCVVRSTRLRNHSSLLTTTCCRRCAVFRRWCYPSEPLEHHRHGPGDFSALSNSWCYITFYYCMSMLVFVFHRQASFNPSTFSTSLPELRSDTWGDGWLPVLNCWWALRVAYQTTDASMGDQMLQCKHRWASG